MTAPGKKHNRKFALCGVDLVKFRYNAREHMAVMREVSHEIERLVIESEYLNGAPFEWVGVTILFGLKNDDAPHFHRISKKYGDLSLDIEIDTHEVLGAGRDVLEQKLAVATLKALIAAGVKYRLPTKALEDRLQEVAGEPTN